MKSRSNILLYSCLLLAFHSSAQEILTLDQAIALALKNNYSILISKNEQEITANNVTPGNAGMLPELMLNASGNLSDNNTKQKYSTGTVVDKTGAQSKNTGTGIGLNWTLFDGMNMFYSYDKLKELNALESLKLKLKIEESLMDIITGYYTLVRLNQLLSAKDSILLLYEERVKISKEKWNVGIGTKSDYLQAQVDRNAQKSSRMTLSTNLASEKINLNRLIGQTPETTFEVIHDIEVNRNLITGEENKSAMSQNNTLLYYQKNISISEFSSKAIKGQLYPRLYLNANYNFTKTENQAGFLLFNQNLGLNAGLAASWTLFNGFNSRRMIRNSSIAIKNSQLFYENSKSIISADLQTAMNQYRNAIEQLKLEEENTNLARENVQISLERFRLGDATSIEIREAQRSYEEGLSRLMQVRYDSKISEITLLKLKGELLKN